MVCCRRIHVQEIRLLQDQRRVALRRHFFIPLLQFSRRNGKSPLPNLRQLRLHLRFRIEVVKRSAPPEKHHHHQRHPHHWSSPRRFSFHFAVHFMTHFLN